MTRLTNVIIYKLSCIILGCKSLALCSVDRTAALAFFLNDALAITAGDVTSCLFLFRLHVWPQQVKCLFFFFFIACRSQLSLFISEK